MEIRILDEHGYILALEGLAYSFQTETTLYTFDEKPLPTERARVLSKLDQGHNKFLESMIVWLDIRAPLYFWKQFDTYRVGVTKQSKSTMHTIMRRDLTQDDFTDKVNPMSIDIINGYRALGDFEWVIANLPDGYLQTRRVCLSYKAIRNILKQRKKHKLQEWEEFCTHMLRFLDYPELLGGDIVQD